MVKNHSDRERGNLLPQHRLLFPIISKFFFLYESSLREDNICDGLCYTSRRTLVGTRKQTEEEDYSYAYAGVSSLDHSDEQFSSALCARQLELKLKKHKVYSFL